ncbi:MAG TPA: hypothetical protein VNT02_09685 [Burkholderiales bacterium]|nr:hypothetical protein [Burkholderiales bacterium]
MGKVVLLVPEAPAPEVAAVKDKPKAKIAQIRLGILDNSKSNADHLLRMLTEGLKAELPIAKVVATRKGNVSLPAPKDIIDQLAAECDFVVSAMGD